MIKYTKGNLLEAEAEALVNTVNTVGVMGKGVALMFKERFPQNMHLYVKACKTDDVQIGKMFVTETGELLGPKWIVNFPTKEHWRPKSKMEWITTGLTDLRRFLVDNNVQSVAIPPLGSGNGGLDWNEVKTHIENTLGNLEDIEILIYEPTAKYQNVVKRSGIQELTPARALIAEVIRRYWVLGMACSLLEIHKLAWFIERAITEYSPDNPLGLDFVAHRYGPYADKLRHLLNYLDGSYLNCFKRINDADPLDLIWFDETKKEHLVAYLGSNKMKPYISALQHTYDLIDGFESPYGLELLATIDWLVAREHVKPATDCIIQGMGEWPYSKSAALRKVRLFDRQSVELALGRLTSIQARESATNI